MSKTFTVDLPLPYRNCSPNRKVHWSAKARDVAQLKEDCYYSYLEAWKWNPDRSKSPPMMQGKVLYTLEFWQGAPGYADQQVTFRDSDNALASCKAMIDALKTANIIKDDSYEFLSVKEIILHTRKESGNIRKVTMTLEQS